ATAQPGESQLDVLTRRLAHSVTGTARVRNHEVLEAAGSFRGVTTIPLLSANAAAIMAAPTSDTLWLNVPVADGDSNLVAAFRADYLWGAPDEHPAETDFI